MQNLDHITRPKLNPYKHKIFYINQDLTWRVLTVVKDDKIIAKQNYSFGNRRRKNIQITTQLEVSK